MPQKIILDCDTGRDDAVAVMLSALSPALDLLGVVTVTGTRPTLEAADNTLRCLAYCGAGHVPVFAGAHLPLVSTLTPGRRTNIPNWKPSPIDGGLMAELPRAPADVQPENGLRWLIRTLLASDGDITLIMTAPLTNLALALRIEPRIVEKIKEIVIMGGGYMGSNMTASAEHNFWFDPEAAKIVLHCGALIRLVTMDACNTAQVNYADVARLRALRTPAAISIADFTRKRIDGVEPGARKDSAQLFDGLAVCAVIDPAVLETFPCYVDIDCNLGPSDARAVFDVAGVLGRAPNATVSIQADEKRMIQILMDVLARRL